LRTPALPIENPLDAVKMLLRIIVGQSIILGELADYVLRIPAATADG